MLSGWQDPVICLGDGFTYERSCIERWFSGHSTSPKTNAVLTAEGKRLTPNRTLKAAISSFRDSAASQALQDAVAAAAEAVAAAAAEAVASDSASFAAAAAGAEEAEPQQQQSSTERAAVPAAAAGPGS